MKIAHLTIRNVLGVQELDLDCGAFNLIEGPNGSGKSSVLNALGAVFKGGQDATLLRQGQERGEIVLVLDDGSEIRKRITEKSQPATLHRPGERGSGSQTAIKALVDQLSMNPVDFLRARPQDRVSVLMECLPLSADLRRLQEIAGDSAKAAPADASALAQIDAVYKEIYDDRTGTNRARESKEATIAQLTATLPVDSTGKALVQDDEATLELRLLNMDEAREAEMSRIQTKLEGLTAEHEAAVAELREQISHLQNQINAKVEKFAEIKSLAAQQRERFNNRWTAERQPVAASLASLRADRDAAARAASTRDTIATMRREADDLRADADVQTARLEALKAYKSELLSALPITGLEVRDGEILREGIPFDRLNKAQQVEIAVEIAKLRSGDLGIICVDDLEMLDAEHFAAFRDQAVASGLQLFVTRVSDGDFAAHAQI